MIAIETNLEQLTRQYEICDRGLIDDYSLKVQMGGHYHEALSSTHPIVYGAHPEPTNLFSPLKDISQNLSLRPGAQVIACSKHQYRMPLGYLGLIQTKGTLARLFVSVTCNDGQVEPGFVGYITIEIVNHSPWTIELPVGSDIAQLYLIKCMSPACRGYRGRYAQGAKAGPTLAIFKW